MGAILATRSAGAPAGRIFDLSAANVLAAGAAAPPHADDDGHGHAHGHGRFDVAWLLVVPMFVLLLIAPPALGSFSAARSGTALGAAPVSDLPAFGRREPGAPVRARLRLPGGL